MMGLGTGTFSVYRGETTNSFGDSIDADIAIATGVVMSILPVRQADTRHAGDRQQQVHYYIARATKGTDIKMGDRLQNERSTTVWYMVTGVHQAMNPVAGVDLSIDLERALTN